MTQQEIDQLLRRTLADGRLSGSEREALAGVVAGEDDGRLAFWRSRAFALAREHPSDPRARQALDWLEEAVKALLPRPTAAAPEEGAYFSPGEECLRAIVGQFGAARQRADVCVFTITDDRITAAIFAAHRRGVALRILTDAEKAEDPGS